MGCGPGAQRWVEGCVWGGKNCRSKAVGGRFEVSFRGGSLSGPDQYGMIECWGWVVGKRNAVCFSYPQGFAVEVPLLQACLAHRILRIQS